MRTTETHKEIDRVEAIDRERKQYRKTDS